MKIKLKYIGQHQPKGVYEIDSKLAKGLIKTGLWEKLDLPKLDEQIWETQKEKKEKKEKKIKKK